MVTLTVGGLLPLSAYPTTSSNSGWDHPKPEPKPRVYSEAEVAATLAEDEAAGKRVRERQ